MRNMAKVGNYDDELPGEEPEEGNKRYDKDGNEIRFITAEEYRRSQREREQHEADKYKSTVSKKTYERWKSREQEETPSWDNYQDDRRWEKKHGLPGEEMEMKDHDPSIKTSTSKEEETSFGGTPTLEMKIQERERTDEEILKVFPNIDRRLMPRITFDSNDRLVFKDHRIWKDGIDHNKSYTIAYEGRPSFDYLRKKLPKVLDGLGKSNVEINEENYEKQRIQEEKQAEREENLEKLRSTREGIQSKLGNNRAKLEEYSNDLEEYEKIVQGHPTTQEAEAVRRNLPRIKEGMKVEREEMKKNEQDLERLNQDITREEESVRNGEGQVEAARERVDQRLLPLRERIKEIFKKHGFTVVAVVSAIGVVIGVIVSNLKAGLTKVANGVGNGLKELGAKLGQILPGMVGAIASFLFRTAGEVIGFLAKNAWLLIVGLVVLAVEQFKKKG